MNQIRNWALWCNSILIFTIAAYYYRAVSFITGKKRCCNKATAATFSFLEQTVITRQGSERFVPVSLSLTGMQSNQMLVSCSNQMGIQKNSVPIHQAQFSTETYLMGNTECDNMNLSANLNASGAKTAVPTKKSVPVSVDKRCPIQDSLHYPGGNGEDISHSWSILASDEAEYQQVIDARKQKRMLSNRESAKRSRFRKQLHLNELNAQVAHLTAENLQLLNKLNIASQQYGQITKENCLLRLEALKLSHKLQGLHHAINAQSHSAFKILSTETGNCGAAHLSSESGTIPHTFASSDHLF
jgi:hypothetical protein